jgi:hypothetical protein
VKAPQWLPRSCTSNDPRLVRPRPRTTWFAQQCTVPVRVIRDGADWVLFGVQIASLLVTMAAVILAYLEIRRGQKERRVDFELTVLRELLIYVGRVDFIRVRALAVTFQPSVLPITRAAAQLPTTADGALRYQLLSVPMDGHETSYLEGLQDEATSELRDAIDSRILERKPNGARPPLYICSAGRIGLSR